MSCVEGDRLDCQPRANSTARSRSTGHDCFHYTERLSFTDLVYLFTGGPLKTHKLELELVAFAIISWVCKQMTTASLLLLVTAAKYSSFSSG